MDFCQIFNRATDTATLSRASTIGASVLSQWVVYSVVALLQKLKKYALSPDQILETGKFRYLDEHLPEMKSRVRQLIVVQHSVFKSRAV